MVARRHRARADLLAAAADRRPPAARRAHRARALIQECKVVSSSLAMNPAHDLDTLTGRIGTILVYRHKQGEVLARIDDDDRAKACRSAIFHYHGMQVG